MKCMYKLVLQCNYTTAFILSVWYVCVSICFYVNWYHDVLLRPSGGISWDSSWFSWLNLAAFRQQCASKTFQPEWKLVYRSALSQLGQIDSDSGSGPRLHENHRHVSKTPSRWEAPGRLHSGHSRACAHPRFFAIGVSSPDPMLRTPAHSTRPGPLNRPSGFAGGSSMSDHCALLWHQAPSQPIWRVASSSAPGRVHCCPSPLAVVWETMCMYEHICDICVCITVYVLVSMLYLIASICMRMYCLYQHCGMYDSMRSKCR